MYSFRAGLLRRWPSWAAQIPDKSSAGLRILVPGYAQWYWRQRERALILFGSFAAGLGVGVFAWGTRTGMAVLGFAFLTHVVSVVDVLRQSAFPGFGRWMPVASASGGLALGVYAPALALAAMVAWPAVGGGQASTGYLVNCCAYRGAGPKRGDWVWARTSPWADPRVGRVVAGPGDGVEWSDHQLRVNGRALNPGRPFRSDGPPDTLAFNVPDGHVLVQPEAGLEPGTLSEGLVLVSNDQVKGRAWARLYPIWNRRLLH
jgi:hypothetical protein